MDQLNFQIYDAWTNKILSSHFIVFISNLVGNDHKKHCAIIFFPLNLWCWLLVVQREQGTETFTLTSWLENLYYRCRCSEKVTNDRRQWKHCIPVWSKMFNIALRCPLIPPLSKLATNGNKHINPCICRTFPLLDVKNNEWQIVKDWFSYQSWNAFLLNSKNTHILDIWAIMDWT